MDNYNYNYITLLYIDLIDNYNFKNKRRIKEWLKIQRTKN